MKSTTPFEGNNIFLRLSFQFFLIFFSSRVQEGLITGELSGSSIINVDETVTVVLSNKIFQRKQSSRFWILEMQNNNWKNGTHDWLRLCGFSNYVKIRVSSRNTLTLHRVTAIWLIFFSENLHALDLNTLEQRIPHVVLDVMWNLQLRVTAMTFFSLFLTHSCLHGWVIAERGKSA